MASGVTVAPLDGTQDGVVFTAANGCSYFGFSARETSGSAAAIFRIREGVGGRILDTVKLLAGESAREWYGPQGVHCHTNLYEDYVSGAYEGSVRVG